MATTRFHFAALLKKVNPSDERLKLAQNRPGEVREWLKEHKFETKNPHSRLSGSYARNTAILDIKDVDVLVFLPEEQLDRTPNAVLLEVKKVLDGFPGANVETSGQRRSVRMDFPDENLRLDIVPVVAKDGLDKPLSVPDRPAEKWIKSDPLGYAERLSRVNQENNSKLVPLVKLIKAWRDVQMKVRRPKSYVLEVMALYAVENGDIVLNGESTAQNLADFFAHIATKYDDLMENGKESPRIPDPMIPTNFITKHWDRSHFETFMRRIREADKAAQKALKTDDDDAASAEWAKVFGEYWPTADEAKAEAKKQAQVAVVTPGKTKVTSTGGVAGYGSAGTIATAATSFHGGDRSGDGSAA